MLPVMKTVSPQAADIYKLLNDGQILSAHEIAKALDILPNAVYRVAKKLMDTGLVEQVNDYPVRFKAVPAQTAVSLYMVAATQNFRREFGFDKPQEARADDGPTISLIKDRPSLLNRSGRDARAASQSIDFIVSGHEIPNDSFLAYRKAATVGAVIRKIVHQKDQTRSSQIQEWKEIGAKVRYLQDFKMRMLIFDKRIVYITSFDSKKNASAFGVRFDYEPLALQMTELFEQNWQKAVEL